MQRRARKKKVVPREHGFWVMLSASSLAGLLLSPTWVSFLVTFTFVLLSILGALLFGRGVRRNMTLQLVSAALLAGLLVPIAVSGHASLEASLRVSVPLAVSYLASALCVQEMLAMMIAWLGALVADVLASWQETAAIALSATLVTGIHFLAPSPKRLKRVGLSIAFAQAVAVLLLAL